MTKEQKEATTLIIIGSAIIDYGARLIIDSINPTFKDKVSKIIKKVKDMEQYLVANKGTSEEQKKELSKVFTRNELILTAELIRASYGLPENTIEEIIVAVKNHTAETVERQ